MRAALILVGLGTLAVMELQTPPRATKSIETPLAQTTLGFAASSDTLTAADRNQTPHAQQQASAQQISSPEPTAPPVQPATAAPEPAPIIEQPERAASAEKAAVVLPKPRPKQPLKQLPERQPKHQIAKATARTTRSKPTVEARPCQPGAFDGLFKALSLPLGCQT
jgi:outer membrane biosynthesis protein TonB